MVGSGIFGLESAVCAGYGVSREIAFWGRVSIGLVTHLVFCFLALEIYVHCGESLEYGRVVYCRSGHW